MGTSARHSVAVQSAATVLPHQPPFLDRKKRHVVLGTPICVAHADPYRLDPARSQDRTPRHAWPD
jgi:hypothetical protein